MAYKRTDAEGNSAVVLVAQAIRKRIREGQLNQGARITQRQIQDEFAVSSSTAREALRVLGGESLLELQAHRGAVVRTFTRQELIETYRLREVVEGLAARCAAERAAAGADTRELEQAHALGEQAASTDDAPAYSAANLAFHEALLKLSGSPRIDEIARNLALPLSRFNHERLLERRSRTQSVHDHSVILETIKEGDAEGAEIAMRNHVRNSGSMMLRALHLASQGNLEA